MGNKKNELSKKITKEAFDSAMEKALKREHLKRYTLISNKRDQILGVIESFIKKDLENLDPEFYKKIIRDSKLNSEGEMLYKDSKTYQDVFKENLAIIPIQNLLGYFIYKSKWEVVNEISTAVPNKKKHFLFIFLFSSFTITILLFWLWNSLKNNPIHEEPIKTENIPILKNKTIKKSSKFLIGSVKDIHDNNIASVDLFLKDFNKKINTNKEGYYTIKDSLIIQSISENNIIEIFLSHKDYTGIKYFINENIVVYNDTISSLYLYKKNKPIQGTQINIKEVINKDNGTINIGPTTINK